MLELYVLRRITCAADECECSLPKLLVLFVSRLLPRRVHLKTYTALDSCGEETLVKCRLTRWPIAIMLAVEPLLHDAPGVRHRSTTPTPYLSMADVVVSSYIFFMFRYDCAMRTTISGMQLYSREGFCVWGWNRYTLGERRKELRQQRSQQPILYPLRCRTLCLEFGVKSSVMCSNAGQEVLWHDSSLACSAYQYSLFGQEVEEI
jgi:hypothetical protein